MKNRVDDPWVLGVFAVLPVVGGPCLSRTQRAGRLLLRRGDRPGALRGCDGYGNGQGFIVEPENVSICGEARSPFL